MTSLDIAHQRLQNQHIARAMFEKPGDVVAWLGGVQAQDYLGALWAVGLRTLNVTEADIEQAIADRTIVRTWPMRGTLHFVAAADIRWILGLLTPRIVAGSARRFQQLDLDDAVFARSKKLFVKALQGNKQLTRGALYKLLEAAGISTASQRGLHILWRLAQDGIICFGAREGKQQTFALLDEWVPMAKTLKRDEALAELARRYFTSHGPATVQDFVWWTGLTTADAKTGLEMVKPKLAHEIVDDQTYWLPRNMPVVKDASPTSYLLPGFDEYMVGYKDRSAVIAPAHSERVNPGSKGMLSPTIVLDGRIVGTWKRTFKKDAVIITTSRFTAPRKSETRAFSASANRYGTFLGMPVIFGTTRNWNTVKKTAEL